MSTATKPHVLTRALTLAVALGVALPPAAVVAAPAKTAAPATDGRTIALLRFSGSSTSDVRSGVQGALEEKGYAIKSVALDLAAAGAKVKCKGEPGSPECLAAVGKWLNSNPKTAADYIIHGRYVAGSPNRVEIVVYDVAKATTVSSFDAALIENDLIAPVVLPPALVKSIEDYLKAPDPITPEEQKLVAELDEPEKTQEEIAAEAKAIEDAERAAAEAAARGQEIDTSNIKVDLRADFKDFCRTGPRNKRKSKEDPKDLRPSCKRGPVFGYWQPRAWVALGLTIGAGLGTIALYSAALAARGDYKDSTDALDAYVKAAGGDPRRDPQYATHNGQSYDALATEVSRTGSVVRQRAIIGDVLLGTTVLLTGVLAIIISQDRGDAKAYIKQEKGLRAIGSSLRVGPMMTRQGGGMGLHLKF